MVIGIPSLAILDKLCDGCLVEKKSIKSFVTLMPTRSYFILEVVHSDVCGPFEDVIVGGNKYFVSFVDEHSRKLYVYMIRHKD